MDTMPWLRLDQVMELNARELSGEDWYTDPHGNESPGRYYETLRKAKHDLKAKYYPPTLIVHLRERKGEERIRQDKWTEMDIGRRIAGCLTDLEVMARMGLIRVKVVLEAGGSTDSSMSEEKTTARYGGVQEDINSLLKSVTALKSS